MATLDLLLPNISHNIVAMFDLLFPQYWSKYCGNIEFVIAPILVIILWQHWICYCPNIGHNIVATLDLFLPQY